MIPGGKDRAGNAVKELGRGFTPAPIAIGDIAGANQECRTGLGGRPYRKNRTTDQDD
jgi:hypothetical protein